MMSMTCWLHCCGRICKSPTRIDNITLSVKLYFVDRRRDCLFKTSLFLRVPFGEPVMTYHHGSLVISLLVGLVFTICSCISRRGDCAHILALKYGANVFLNTVIPYMSGLHELIRWTACSQHMQWYGKSFHNHWVLRQMCVWTSLCF